MHILQQKILELSDQVNLTDLTLRQIGGHIGEQHPQNVKHHLAQLYKKNLLRLFDGVVSRVTEASEIGFYNIPVLGSANCGQAVTFANEHFESFLTVSPKVLRGKFNPKHTFAVKATGNSMNRAQVHGQPISEGDYVIIDNQARDLNFYNNKYVLSIIGGMANIKKLVIDRVNNCILLLSESKEPYAPIYIHNDDFDDYMVNGVVTEVIKRPSYITT